MLTQKQMSDIRDDVYAEIYDDLDLVDNYDNFYYEADFDVFTDVDETKSVTFTVEIDPEDLWEACFRDIEKWETSGKVNSYFDAATPEDLATAEAYRKFIYDVYMSLIDMRMDDKRPFRGANTFDDFAYDYCDAHGHSKDYDY
jgi:hypothetical protein